MKFIKLFSVGVFGVLVWGSVLSQSAIRVCPVGGGGACIDRPYPASSITSARLTSNYVAPLPSADALRPILDQMMPQLPPVAGAPENKKGTFATGIFGGQITDASGSVAAVSACIYGFGDDSLPGQCPTGSGRVDFKNAVSNQSN